MSKKANFSLFFRLYFALPPTCPRPLTSYPYDYNARHKDVLGRVTIGLYGNIAPKAARNFYELSTGQNGYGYTGSRIFRSVKNFMVQGGDFEQNTGAGGHSIYKDNKNQTFEDESFMLKHNQTGLVSMANSGPNSNGSQFFVLVTELAQWCDGRHVAFGKVIDGLWILMEVNMLPTDTEQRPLTKVVIRASGGQIL